MGRKRRSNIRCMNAEGPFEFLSLGVESLDIYGKPITLNYQGSSSFKTCAGGCCTLILIGVFFFKELCKTENSLLLIFLLTIFWLNKSSS